MIDEGKLPTLGTQKQQKNRHGRKSTDNSPQFAFTTRQNCIVSRLHYSLKALVIDARKISETTVQFEPLRAMKENGDVALC